MIGPGSLEEFNPSFVTHIQPMEAGFDLGTPHGLVISNRLIMVELSKLHL